MSELERQNQPKRKSKIGLFFKTLFVTLIVLGSSFFVVVAGLYFYEANGEEVAEADETAEFTARTAPKDGVLSSIFKPKEEKIYGLLVGTDYVGSHTDVMIMGCFDTKTERISLISLPRDSKVTLTADSMAKLRDLGGPLPSNGICKLTEVHHYAYQVDKEKAVYYLEDQLTAMFGVKFGFYVKVDLNAFDYLVDEIGGVTFDVPVRMYHNDPTQDLLIDLNPGVQLLNGKKAEGLVRFRGYPGGDDFMRMKVQQEFIKAFIKKLMADGNIVKNAPAMISAALQYVKTDFDLKSLPGYIKYLKTFTPENIDAYTLPAAGTESLGKDYVIIDEEKSAALINEVFFAEPEDIAPIPSDGLRIQVLNGGEVSGLAQAGKDLLASVGLDVAAIGDYGGVRSDGNRIFVAKRGMGYDLKEIIKNSDIVYDPSLDANYDIIVVVGKKGLD